MVKPNNSKQGRILQHLNDGKVITQMMAVKMFNAYRLSGVIYRLKKEGYDITTQMVTRNKITFAMYYMKQHYAI